MKDCVSKDAIEIIKKLYQALLLAKERLADVVYGSEDQCFNKNVHLIIQHPSLGSMTEGPTDKPEILIPMLKPWQEPSIYICLSSVKIVDFTHPK